MSIATSSLWVDGPVPSLRASREIATGELIFPPVIAASPLADRYESVQLDTAGSVYSFTVIHPGPKSGESPYALGYVDIPGPVRIFGRLQGTSHPRIGDRFLVRPHDTFGFVFDYVGSGEAA